MSGKLKLAAGAALVVALVVLAKVLNLQEVLRSALERTSGLGIWGMLAFAGLYVLACVFLIPGSILTLGAGAVYGALQGTLLVSVSSILGAAAAFLIGRYLARGWVAKKIEGNPRFAAIDRAVAGEAWKIVLLTRLSPLFPFSLLNYAFGLTRVSFKDYFWASWIGMLPGTALYVYAGSLAGDLASLGTRQRPRSAGEWILYAVGLAATLAVTLVLTRVAKRALGRRVSGLEKEPAS